MKCKAGDKVKIKTWDAMGVEFTVNIFNDIPVESDCCFSKRMERAMPSDRIITLTMPFEDDEFITGPLCWRPDNDPARLNQPYRIVEGMIESVVKSGPEVPKTGVLDSVPVVPAERKIIQIVGDAEGHLTYSLCDDGCILSHYPYHKNPAGVEFPARWDELECDVPQPEDEK